MTGGVLIPPGPVRVLVATKPVDFRKGMDGLAALVKEQLKVDPFSGVIFCFRARRADRVKLLFWDGTGLCLFAKRLEGGKFRWPRIEDGVMRLSAAQLAALIEGLRRRHPDSGGGCAPRHERHARAAVVRRHQLLADRIHCRLRARLLDGAGRGRCLDRAVLRDRRLCRSSHLAFSGSLPVASHCHLHEVSSRGRLRALAGRCRK